MSDFFVLRGRKLSIDNATLIGTGFCSDVYQIDDETVVKVLKKDGPEDAEREILLSKWALTKGIPTAISYDVVDVNGHPGLVYELLGRNNLRNALRDNPDDFDSLMKRYVELLHTINSAEVGDEPLPAAIDDLREELDGIKHMISPEEYAKMSALFDSIPEATTLVHRDCHGKNIKLVKDDFILIDLDTLSLGDPIFELSALYCTYKVFPDAKRETKWDAFLDQPTELSKKILETILRDYYPNISDEAKARNADRIATVAYMHMISFIRKNSDSFPYDLDSVMKSFRYYLVRVDDLVLEKE